MAKLNIQDYYKNQANNPYALSTDAQSIKSMYDQATAAAQAVEERGIANAEAAWQRNLAGTQATALDTIRKNNASAIATGASKGMQAANELSAILGLQDTTVEESTALAQQRLDLADVYAAEYAKNAITAQETANANKQAMMNAAMQQYGYDTTLEAAHFNNAETALLDYAAQAEKDGKTDLSNSIYALLGTQGPSTGAKTALAAENAAPVTVMAKTYSVGAGVTDASGNQIGVIKAAVTDNDSLKKTLDDKGISKVGLVQHDGKYYTKGKGGMYWEVALA